MSRRTIRTPGQLFYTAINLGTGAFPLNGSHSDPGVTGLILVGITLLVAR